MKATKINKQISIYEDKRKSDFSLLLFKFKGIEYKMNYESGDLDCKEYEKFYMAKDIDEVIEYYKINYKNNIYVEPAEIDSFYNPISKKWENIENLNLTIQNDIKKFNKLSQIKKRHPVSNFSTIESIYAVNETFLDREMPYFYKNK